MDDKLAAKKLIEIENTIWDLDDRFSLKILAYYMSPDLEHCINISSQLKSDSAW